MTIDQLVARFVEFYEQELPDYFVVSFGGQVWLPKCVGDASVLLIEHDDMTTGDVLRSVGDFFSLPFYVEAQKPLLFGLWESVESVKLRLGELRDTWRIASEDIKMINDTVVQKSFGQYTLPDYQLLYQVLAEVYISE